MSKKIHIVIPGQPQSKGRPRFSRRGKFVSTYTPKKTEDYEFLIRNISSDLMGNDAPLSGAVSALVDFYMQIPNSWSNKRKKMAEDGEILATKKIDIDNGLKIIFDGMNGIVYNDDAQIIKLIATKSYSSIPRVEITIEDMEST